MVVEGITPRFRHRMILRPFSSWRILVGIILLRVIDRFWHARLLFFESMPNCVKLL